MRSRPVLLAAVALLALALAAPAVATPDDSGPPFTAAWHEDPIVIGHRGASGYRPEHTLAAYELAIDLGADYIEPDLVPTKDGVLVARHENEISGTTDVADHPEFADREATKTIDGDEITGWFTEDFTLEELKTLRAVERLPETRPENTAFDGLYEVPTLQEVIDLAQERGVGIYPETKHPTYFDGIGLSLEEPLVEILHANGYRGPRADVYVQSFEVTNLKELAGMTRVPLVQLIGGSGAPYDLVAAGEDTTYDDLVTRRGLRDIARYADGIGPSKTRIVPWDEDDMLGEPTDLVHDAHHVGLVVHPYTIRRENTFLPADFRQGDPDAERYDQATGDVAGEIELLVEIGVDGFFTDNPDVGAAVVGRIADARPGRS